MKKFKTSSGFLSKLIKFFAGLWGLSIVVFIANLGVATAGFTGVIQNTKYGESQSFMVIFSATIVIGVLAFGLMILTFITNELVGKDVLKFERSYVGLIVFVFKLVVVLAILPIFLIYQVVGIKEVFKKIRAKTFKISSLIPRKLSTIVGKLALVFVICITFLPVWAFGYAVILYLTPAITGLAVFPSYTKVTGQSMMPTLKDNSMIGFYFYNNLLPSLRGLKKGDIVVFSNEQTKDENNQTVNFVKRIIALPKDKVETRDGYLYVNGQLLVEPFTAKPRSTFGGKFLEDCKTIEIPAGNIFVLGDNRARSSDSRTIGFVSLNNIASFIPVEKQDIFKSTLRDASHDKDKAGLASFDTTSYYGALNKIRTDNKLKPLKVNKKLEEASKKKAESIIQLNEVKSNLDNSKYPLEKAMREMGYSNIITGGMSTTGYFDSEDLANYWMEYDTKNTVLEKDYQETGIGMVVGKVNGCETQVIVQMFGGYVPPNYKQEDIDGWLSALNRLREIYPNWERGKSNPPYYNANKADLDRILEIINIRIIRIDRIALRMKANQWLTNEEKGWADQDKALYDEQESLATKLNNWRP